MKFFAAALAACVVGALALTEQQKAKLKEYKDACKAETGADPAEVDKAQKGDWTNNEKMRCFAACMMKKLSMMTADGELDETGSRRKMAMIHSEEMIEEIMTKCKDLKGADTCQTGFKFLKCYTDIQLQWPTTITIPA